MAKDFSQYEDDNPVMKILGAAKAEEEQRTVNQILTSSDDSSKNQTQVSSINKDISSESPAETEIKKILMNISIRETTKKEWKMFFLEHDLSMTQGIETAVEYLRSEVEKGTIRLTKGGITK